MDIPSWEKIFSGKFVFTVITAVVFAYCACKQYLTPEQIYFIIVLVATFYFNKKEPPKDTPQ